MSTSSSVAPPEPLLTGAFFRLTFVHLLSALGFSSMLLLPLYLEGAGLGRGHIGQVMAASAVGGLLARPLIALALDRIGRRPVLFCGLLISSACLAYLPELSPEGYGLHLLRLFFGVSAGALFTGFFTFAADIIPASRRTEGIALFGISGLLPLVVNPSATLLEVRPEEIPIFLRQVSFLILCAIPILMTVPEAPRPAPLAPMTGAGALARLRAVLRSLTPPQLRPLWWVAAALGASIAAFMAFSAVVLSRRGIPFPTALWFTYAGGAALIRLTGARLPDRIGPERLVAPGLLLYGAAFIMLLVADNFFSVLTAGLFAGLSHGLCFPLLTSLVVSRSEERLRGSSLALFTGTWELAGLLTTPLLGFTADRFGDEALLCAAAGISVVAAPLWWWKEGRRPMRGKHSLP